MREVLEVWRDTRAIVLVAVTAALYAAILIPMKVLMPLIPGFTEVRPGNVLPILFSFLFGPVAAWGAAPAVPAVVAPFVVVAFIGALIL